jgi:endonuclease/exonuclease/phosphatase family metal-dependent hydrolase
LTPTACSTPTKKVVGTFNSFKGETTGDKIDYIFVSATTRTLEATIHRDHLNGRYLSDHFPVSARIDFLH